MNVIKSNKILWKSVNLLLSIFFIITIMLSNSMISEAAGSAEDSVSINVTLDSTDIFKIAGNISSGEGKTVTLLVKSPSGAYMHIDEKLSGLNGYYQFSLYMDMLQDEGGSYTFTVGGKSVDARGHASFYYPNKQERDDAVAAVNASDTPEKMRDAFVTYSRSMFFETSDYDNLEKWKDVYQRLIVKRPYSDIPALRNLYFESVAFSALNHAAEPNQMAMVLYEYNDIFKLDMGSDSYYAKLEKEKNKFLQLLIDKQPYAEINNIQDTFKKQMTIPLINEVKWVELEKILIAFQDELQLDFNGDYTKLDKKEDIPLLYKAMATTDFRDASEVKVFFNKTIAELLKPQEEEETSSSKKVSRVTSSGSGSSGGSAAPNPIPAPTPVPTEPSPKQTKFTDLDSVSWAEESIRALADKGIVSGTGNHEFKPNDKVTREQFIKMLLECFGLVDESAESNFTDVPNTAWSYKYIASAYKLGITNGLGDGTFGIGSEISRQDMAALSYRVATIAKVNLEERNEAVDFSDSENIDSYAFDGITAMQKAGIINGVGNGGFAPKDNTTRAQAAKVIYELLKYAK